MSLWQNGKDWIQELGDQALLVAPCQILNLCPKVLTLDNNLIQIKVVFKFRTYLMVK